eukprot:355743-Chlamydomonas_euryale.AAC.3
MHTESLCSTWLHHCSLLRDSLALSLTAVCTRLHGHLHLRAPVSDTKHWEVKWGKDAAFLSALEAPAMQAGRRDSACCSMHARRMPTSPEIALPLASAVQLSQKSGNHGEPTQYWGTKCGRNQPDHQTSTAVLTPYQHVAGLLVLLRVVLVVRVRVTGSGYKTKGIKQRAGRSHKGSVTARGPQPPHSSPTPPTRT